MNQKIIQEYIITSIQDLYHFDHYLITHDVHEQTISALFAVYLRNNLNSFTEEKWDIDPEYNRNIFKPKSLPQIGNVKPDIIIHKRGKNNDNGDEFNNLIVIEMKKKPTKQEKTIDISKIEAFINESPYHYCYGLFIGLHDKIENNIIEWRFRYDMK